MSAPSKVVTSVGESVAGSDWTATPGVDGPCGNNLRPLGVAVSNRCSALESARDGLEPSGQARVLCWAGTGPGGTVIGAGGDELVASGWGRGD